MLSPYDTYSPIYHLTKNVIIFTYKSFTNVFQKFRDEELLKLKESADKDIVQNYEYKEEEFDRMEEDTDDDIW